MVKVRSISPGESYMLPKGTLILALVFLLQPAARAEPGDEHLIMGNPSKAVADAARPDPENYLMVKPQFALSYNSRKGTPNWVSYRLRKSDMGKAQRGMFHPDAELPRKFFAVKPFDYHFNTTGMTRGHMCPSSHRNNTETNAHSTFVMTNMVPQTEELNAGAWETLERYCRDLAFRENKEMYIVCGPHGVGGRTDKGFFKTIGDGHVTVPKSCWKVVMVLDALGKSPLSKVNTKTRLLAVVMPNDRTPDKADWRDYVTSVQDIEMLTGYAFFDEVAADIIGPLKKKKHD